MATLGGVLWFVVFLVVATVAVLAATFGGVVLVSPGLLLSPALALALGLLLLLKRGKPMRREFTPRVPEAARSPSPTGPATAGVVKRAA